LLTGDDRRSDELIEELGDEFPSIRVARAACQARRSIIVNGHCYTSRDPLDPDRLPKELFTCSDEAAAVLIAPLSAENHEFVGNMLRSHPKSVWQPSAEQVQDARQTYRLMNSATITVMNQSEAEILTGENDPMEAIMVCRDNMDRGLIVTMKSGAVGWFNGDWAYASAPVVNSVVREVAAGDWFAGIFTLAWSGDGYDFAKAMALGQAAAARYVGDLPPLACLEELAEWYSQQPKKPIPGKVPQHLGYRRVASATIATLATAAIIVFLLLRASSF